MYRINTNPGTGGLTYGDIVTEENLDFIPYIEEVC